MNVHNNLPITLVIKHFWTRNCSITDMHWGGLISRVLEERSHCAIGHSFKVISSKHLNHATWWGYVFVKYWCKSALRGQIQCKKIKEAYIPWQTGLLKIMFENFSDFGSMMRGRTVSGSGVQQNSTATKHNKNMSADWIFISPTWRLRSIIKDDCEKKFLNWVHHPLLGTEYNWIIDSSSILCREQHTGD